VSIGPAIFVGVPHEGDSGRTEDSSMITDQDRGGAMEYRTFDTRGLLPNERKTKLGKQGWRIVSEDPLPAPGMIRTRLARGVTGRRG
jgi:hypothetical protein